MPPLTQVAFYRTSKGAEADLVLECGGKKTVVEIKASPAPQVERGFWNAIDDLQPDNIRIIAPVERRYKLKENVEALTVEDFISDGRNAGWLG